MNYICISISIYIYYAGTNAPQKHQGTHAANTLVRQNVCSRGSYWFVIFCSWKGRCTQTCFKQWQIEYGRRCEWITEFRNRNGLMAGTSDWSGQISPALIQCLRWCKTEWAACTPCLKTEKLKYWKIANPLETGVDPPHTHTHTHPHTHAHTHMYFNQKTACLGHDHHQDWLPLVWVKLKPWRSAHKQIRQLKQRSCTAMFDTPTPHIFYMHPLFRVLPVASELLGQMNTYSYWFKDIQFIALRREHTNMGSLGKSSRE